MAKVIYKDTIFEKYWQHFLSWALGFLILIYYAPQIIIITYVWGENCIRTHTVTPFPMKADDIIGLIYLLFGFFGYSLGKGAIDSFGVRRKNDT